jgi:hypothetical protein
MEGKPTRIPDALTLYEVLKGFRWLLDCLGGQPPEVGAMASL